MVQQEKEVMSLIIDNELIIGNQTNIVVSKQSTPFGLLDIANAFSNYDFNVMRKILANLKDDCRLGYKDILQEFIQYIDNEIVVKR